MPPRRFPLRPVPPAGGGNQTIVMPPPCAPGGVAPCTCSDLEANWDSLGTEASWIIAGDGSLSFAISGVICPDTEWTFVTTWSPENLGEEPEILQIGASAWVVRPTDAGLLTIAVTADCGGQAISVGTLVLTVVDAVYYSGGAAGWVEITTLPGVTFTVIDDSGPGAAKIQLVGSDFTDTGTGLRQCGTSVVYGVALRGIHVQGLMSAAHAAYARIRVRVTSFDNSANPYSGVAGGASIASGTSETGTVYVYGPIDLDNFVIPAGVDGSGDEPGTFSFQVDVEIVE